MPFLWLALIALFLIRPLFRRSAWGPRGFGYPGMGYGGMGYGDWWSRRMYRHQMRQMRWAMRHQYGWRPRFCFGWIAWLAIAFLFIPPFRHWVTNLFRSIFWY